MSKFASIKDEVVYRATLNGFVKDEMGNVQFADGWFGLVENFYGRDYIVNEDTQGFVTVQPFPRAIGYTVVGPNISTCSRECFDAWMEIVAQVEATMPEYGDEDEDWEMIPDEYYESADQKFGYA